MVVTAFTEKELAEFKERVCKEAQEAAEKRFAEERKRTEDEMDKKGREFCGYLSGALPQLHSVPVPEIALAWERYKEDSQRRVHYGNVCPVSTDVQSGKPVPKKVLPQALEEFWRSTYLTAFDGKAPKGSAAYVADSAVEEYLQRFSLSVPMADVRRISVEALERLLRQMINRRAVTLWNDPDSCERRAVAKLMAEGFDEILANRIIDFIRDETDV